jgi:hypothetical protein
LDPELIEIKPAGKNVDKPLKWLIYERVFGFTVKFQRLTTGMTCLPEGRLVANHLNESNSSTKQYRESKENQCISLRR